MATLDNFGFQPIDEIPVDKNDWSAMLDTFMGSDIKVIVADHGKNASNVAGAIRKVAKDHGIDVNVVSKGGKVYVEKK